MANDRPRQQAWRSASAQSTAPEPGKSRRGIGKRIAVLALVLIIIAVIAGILTYTTPVAQPIFLGIVVTQYDDPAYPPNPWAQHDGERLRGYFGEGSALARQSQEKTSLLGQIDGLAKATSADKDKGQPVVVYLNAFAAGHAGKAQLLLGRAKPDSPTSWLPLEDVLSALRQCSGPRLLLLDVAHPIADAHRG